MISALAHALIGAGKENGEIKRGSAEGEKKRAENHGGQTTRVGLTTPVVLRSVQIPLLLRTVEFIEAWEEWIEHRLECGRTYRWPTTIRCFKKTMNQCEDMGSDRAVKAIDYSLTMCYRGLFEQPPRKFYKPQPKRVTPTVFSGATPRL